MGEIRVTDTHSQLRSNRRCSAPPFRLSHCKQGSFWRSVWCQTSHISVHSVGDTTIFSEWPKHCAEMLSHVPISCGGFCGFFLLFLLFARFISFSLVFLIARGCDVAYRENRCVRTGVFILLTNQQYLLNTVSLK